MNQLNYNPPFSNLCRTTICPSYSSAVNLYQNPNYTVLSVSALPPPPSNIYYQPIAPCGTPYPTPTYTAPNPCCNNSAISTITSYPITPCQTLNQTLNQTVSFPNQTVPFPITSCCSQCK